MDLPYVKKVASPIFTKVFNPDDTSIKRIAKGLGESGNSISQYMHDNNIGILVSLEYVHIHEWLEKDVKFKKIYSDNFPLIWGLFYSTEPDSVMFDFHIHPMKCFPTLYMDYSSRSSEYPIHIETMKIDDDEFIVDGCMYPVLQNDKYYQLKAADYCYAFGLPFNCYDEENISILSNYLDSLNPLDIWTYNPSNYLQELDEQSNHSFHNLRQEVIPVQYYFFKDKSIDAIRGLINKVTKPIFSETLWYQKGRDFIRTRSIGEVGEEISVEELSILRLRKRLIDEFGRCLLILMRRDIFEEINKIHPPEIQYDPGVLNLFIKMKEERELLTLQDINYYLNRAIDTNQVNVIEMTKDRFMVFDVEYLKTPFPGDPRGKKQYMFPSVFSSIVWEGKRKGVSVKINPFVLPCHFCTEKCRELKKHTIKYDCITFSKEFIYDQIDYFQHFLDKYDNFKILTFGKSDQRQVEHAISFLGDAELELTRKNRKETRSLTEIAINLALGSPSLNELEKTVIMDRIDGWDPQLPHDEINPFYLQVRGGSIDWERGFEEAIRACAIDAECTFFYHILTQYPTEHNRKDAQLALDDF